MKWWAKKKLEGITGLTTCIIPKNTVRRLLKLPFLESIQKAISIEASIQILQPIDRDRPTLLIDLNSTNLRRPMKADLEWMDLISKSISKIP